HAAPRRRRRPDRDSVRHPRRAPSPRRPLRRGDQRTSACPRPTRVAEPAAARRPRPRTRRSRVRDPPPPASRDRRIRRRLPRIPVSPRLAPALRVARRGDRGARLLRAHAEAQAQIESERRGLVRSSEAKSQFFARMSHELRTPLQSIMGYVDLLQAGVVQPLVPAQCEMLDRIATSERLLVRVIDDLITYARIEAGHVTYNIRPVAVDGILRTVESVVAPLAHDHGIHFEVRPCGDRLAVSADADKLDQILVN